MCKVRWASITALAACFWALSCDRTSGSEANPGEGARSTPPSARPRPASESLPVAPGAPSTSPAMLRKVRTVFLILMENTAWSDVKGSPDAPFINDVLLPQASVADAYRGPLRGHLHPSLPNYVWLEAGDNLGITDDDNPAAHHLATTEHLVTQLEKAGITWRSYQEDIAGDVCPLLPTGQYMPKHNAMVYFDDVTNGNDPKSARCIEHVRPLGKRAAGRPGGDFESDLESGKLARYNFITPNQCNDMHSSCPPRSNPTRQGDDWLARWVPRILESDAYKNDGAVFITWDEAGSSDRCPAADCPIGLMVLSPLAKGGGYRNATSYDHSSLLRTLQEIFAVSPFLRAAAQANDLADLFKPSP